MAIILCHSQEPVQYDQGTWAQIGEASCISILDLLGHNCHSRLANSVRHSSLQSLLGSTIRPRTGRTTAVRDVVPQGVGIHPEDVAARERPCWRSGCCWADGRDGRDGRGRGAARARPASRDGRARSRAATPKAEAAEGRDLEVKDVKDVKVGKGLNKAELRIAGARAIPRPEVRDEGIGEKAGSMGTRNWPNLPPESYQHMEVLHPTLLQARRPSKLERLSSAKRDAKNGQPVSCRESKDSKGRVTPAMERLPLRRRSLSGDPRKAP